MGARRILLLILGVAVVLRLWGLTYGLPDVYHTDEWFEVKRALKLGVGVFDLERIGKGGYYYLLFLVFGAFYGLQRLLGNVAGTGEFLLSIFRDPTGLWIAGRTTTVAIGGLNVWLIYRAGLGLRDRAVGLIAAAALAIHMLHVNSSHSITVDVPLVCLLTLGFALIDSWQDRPDLGVRHYAVLGVVSAFAAATKIPGAVIAVCIFLMHVRRFERRRALAVLDYLLDRRLAAYVFVGAATYVALVPGILFSIGDILSWVVSFAVPAEPVDPSTLTYAYHPARLAMMREFYAATLFPLSYTVLPLLFLAGVVTAIRRGGVLRQSPLFFGVIFAAFLLSSKNPYHIYARYVLPLVPLVLLYAAFALVELHDRFRSGASKLLAPALALLVGVPMLVDTVRLDLQYGLPDTRTAAREWIEANVPAGDSIYLSGELVTPSALTAQLRMTPERVDEKLDARLSATGQVRTREKSTYYETYKRALMEYEPTYDLILLDDREDLGRALEEDRGEWALVVDEGRLLFDVEFNRVAFSEYWDFLQRIDSDSFEVVRRFSREKGWRGTNLTLYRRTHRETDSPAGQPL